jgi:hypothetical protein
MQKRKTLGELKPLAPLLGKTRGEARIWIKETKPFSPTHEWVRLEVVRVVREDGAPNEITCDSRLDRVNVEIEGGVISKIVETG